MSQRVEDLIRRLGATVRAAELYAPTHPVVNRTAAGLLAALTPALNDSPSVIVAFLGDDVVVNDFRLPRRSANMAGFIFPNQANVCFLVLLPCNHQKTQH